MEGAMLSLPGRLEQLLRLHGSMLPKGADDEIPLIKRDLEEIISILHRHSEPKLEDDAMVVRCWMKEARELSYDMEDCIDQYEHAAGSRTDLSGPNIRRRKLSRRQRGSKIPQKLKQRLWMANKIREFSLRAQEALRRHAMNNHNNLGSTSTSRGDGDVCSTTQTQFMVNVDAVLNDLNKLKNLLAAIPAAITSNIRRVGIDASMNKIESWLAVCDGEEKLKVVSIVGVGGIGKTTLANELYRKLGRQFECRAFVRLSQKPDMRTILTNILSQIRPQHQPDNWKVHTLISNIRKQLQDQRYLIIVDDLWTTSTWDIIKSALPDGYSCSRILTTTEIEDLALQSCSYDSKYIFQMKPLGQDDSRSLFLSTVFGSHSNCPPELSEVSYDIASKCGGLPLAIVTTASLLASQLENQERWDYINKTFGYSLMANSNLEGMKQLLNLCYNNLPQHLKSCMLYLGMYQEDTIIWKDDLVNQWMAEGLISAVEEHGKEEISRSCFDELVVRKIIQPVHINHNGEILSGVVRRMVLNFIAYKSIEDNFIIAIDHPQAITRLADKVRRLSIHFGNVEDATLPTNMRLSQVRTLALWGILKCTSFITEFRLLKVLILHFWGDEDSVSNYDLTKISELVRLRYLKVTSNVTLKLPTQMQSLRYLETLKIDGKISAVPSDIIYLPGLLHLSLPAKTNLPNGIIHMTSLRKIAYFDLSCNSEENVWSLGELTNLWDIQLSYSDIHSDNLKNNMECLGSILGKLCNLKSITLSPAGSSYDNTLQINSTTSTRISVDGWSSVSSPPALLQRFELSPCVCIFSNLPNWIGQLGNLCILKIGIREVTNNDVDVLKVLPELTVLSLYVHTKPTEEIVIGNAGFSILKYFKFRCSIAWMKFKEGAMRNLQKLKLGFDVHRAYQHDTIPVGIGHLSGLKEISAKIRVACTAGDLCRRFAESALTNAIRMHPRQPSVKIRCVDWTFDGKDGNNAGTQEEENRTLQKHHIVKEGSNETSAVDRRKKQRREGTKVRMSSMVDDGFSWRKYGQKPIEGAMHPRNYYRCASQGCRAAKHVQATDDNPLIVDVMYHGEHTCTPSGSGKSKITLVRRTPVSTGGRSSVGIAEAPAPLYVRSPLERLEEDEGNQLLQPLNSKSAPEKHRAAALHQARAELNFGGSRGGRRQ
ncbi:disease resistance protein RGA5-like isoform X2 [Oryza brachyantha]|uniref:WRKY domain-containing protein n=1 Tax=Oryza brachyantha TaxID=4533 RepID=J3NA98_ORYBR|nr:disease resistance protein RGA5-like isoform X2 [Oryza brachyantha]